MAVEGSLSLRNHLGVRDLLRRDEALREEYGAVTGLAEREWDDMNVYSVAKNGILGKLLARAGIGEKELADIESVNVRPGGGWSWCEQRSELCAGGNRRGGAGGRLGPEFEGE